MSMVGLGTMSPVGTGVTKVMSVRIFIGAVRDGDITIRE